MIDNIFYGDITKILKDKIHFSQKEIKIEYPCIETNNCTYISFIIHPGLYNFSLYGASGGVNEELLIEGETTPDSPSAGGFVTGIIRIKKTSHFYAHIGGRGILTNSLKGSIVDGGYNGGGGSEVVKNYLITGGGSTDIRADSDTPYHRIIVAGGAGGSDDHSSITENDGKGGSGGGLISQSFYVDSELKEGYEATQLKGYSFINGESGCKTGSKHPDGYKNINIYNELAGAGGGWFGGFSSNHNDGGASGGSSFALTNDAEIPSNPINIYNRNFEIIDNKNYAFDPNNSPYIFYNVQHKRGVWYGNGLIKIFLLHKINNFQSCKTFLNREILSLFIINLVHK